jgi:Right handed beta helix region
VLQIENCVIDGFSEGIDFSLANAAQVSIKDTVIRNSASNGIAFFTSSGLIKASIDNCHFDNNGSAGIFDGLNIVRGARVTVRNSVATGNTGAGFNAVAGDLNLENCEASNNRDGLVASGSVSTTGTVTVSNCIVTNNSQTGFTQSAGGVFNSLGNNIVRRNGTNTSGTINSISGT